MLRPHSLELPRPSESGANQVPSGRRSSIRVLNAHTISPTATKSGLCRRNGWPTQTVYRTGSWLTEAHAARSSPSDVRGARFVDLLRAVLSPWRNAVVRHSVASTGPCLLTLLARHLNTTS